MSNNNYNISYTIGRLFWVPIHFQLTTIYVLGFISDLFIGSNMTAARESAWRCRSHKIYSGVWILFEIYEKFNFEVSFNIVLAVYVFISSFFFLSAALYYFFLKSILFVYMSRGVDLDRNAISSDSNFRINIILTKGNALYTVIAI